MKRHEKNQSGNKKGKRRLPEHKWRLGDMLDAETRERLEAMKKKLQNKD